jgi:hypothetical protein
MKKRTCICLLFEEGERRDLELDQFPKVCRVVVIATDVIGRNPLSRNCEIPLTPARTTNTPSKISVESIKQAGVCYTHDLAHRNERR